MTARPQYAGAYRRARQRLLASRPPCVHCGALATEADHQPPISTHSHREESGCCTLVPSCHRCARRQGRALAGRPPVTTGAELEVDAAGFDVADPVWNVPWLDDLRDVPANAVWPRIMSAPHPAAVGSLGGEVAAYAETRTGKVLRWWQRLTLARALEVDDAGALVWPEALVSLARQLGKSWLLREWAMWRIGQTARFGEPQDVMHTGKDVAICREVQRPARLWAKARPDTYKVREVNGQEEIEHLADGSRWMIRAKEAVYGYSGAFAVVDEAWKVAAVTVEEGLVPTMAEREQAQIALVSTAHRKATTLMLTRRSTALSDLHGDRLLIVEWSAPRDAELDDVDAWRAASPHWTKRRHDLIADRLTAARAGETDDPDEPDPIAAFTAQWLNIWPARVAKAGPGDPYIEAEAWQRCEGALPDTDRVPGYVALEENRDGRAAAAFAAAGADGRFEVDGIACDAWDTAVRYARKFLEARPGSQLIVAASMGRRIPDDMPSGGRHRLAGTTETRRALPLLRSLVAERQVVHDRTNELDAQVTAARVRVTSGGLVLLPGTRSDLLRGALWALWEAQMPPPAPGVR